eukprot:6194470-Pleurochrysis_carterae.AAC.2
MSIDIVERAWHTRAAVSKSLTWACLEAHRAGTHEAETRSEVAAVEHQPDPQPPVSPAPVSRQSRPSSINLEGLSLCKTRAATLQGPTGASPPAPPPNQSAVDEKNIARAQRRPILAFMPKAVPILTSVRSVTTSAVPFSPA